MRRALFLPLVAIALLRCVGSDPVGSSTDVDGGGGTGSSSGNPDPGADAGGSTIPSGPPECEANQARCVDKQSQKCTAEGKWGSLVPCTNQVCIDGTCQGVCEPGKTKCDNANGIQTCEANGQWSAPNVCTNSTCIQGKCSGSCSPGQAICSGNGLQTCQPADGGYEWGDPVSCGNQTCCGPALGQSCQGACAPLQTQCSGNAGMQTCGTCGVWGQTTACNNQTCTGAYPAGACNGSCAPGQVQCIAGNVAQSCQANGTWGGDVACSSSDKTCYQGVCSGVCAPGQERCVTDVIKIETCNTMGQYVQTTCPKINNFQRTCVVTGTNQAECQQ